MTTAAVRRILEIMMNIEYLKERLLHTWNYSAYENKHECKEAADTIASMQAENAALKSELEEARKDGQRLAYVLENGRPDGVVNSNDECGYGYYSITEKGEMVRWHATKIEAIDYALQQSPNTPPKTPGKT